MPNPCLVKYWGGMFRLVKENLPAAVQSNISLQNSVLQLLAAKFAFKKWGNTLPADRFTEMNDYVYSLLQSYFP